MNPLKKLAGQTAIYGVSSIVGRLLNYFLVPFYSRLFIPAEYGIVGEMYSYVSLLIVILTYGMETTFFRYYETEKNKKTLYSTSLISLATTSFLFVFFALIFSHPIANTLRYRSNSEYVVWFALIIALDALSAIPFAKLRSENKAKKFAVIKLINIGVNIALNFFFLLICPYLVKHNILPGFTSLVFKGKIGVGYIFIANLISSAVTILLLIPDMIIKYKFDFSLWKRMMPYALPLLIVGFAGIINETMDRVFLKWLLPENISMHEVGIYSACYKISLMMTIFIQAFRFSAEPFFFSHSKNENAQQIYADVMKYFVIVCSLIFLVIMLYMDFVKYFVGKQYYSGLKIVPILLLANMFLGIYYNLSIWYKLKSQTKYGAYISIFGALITLVINFIFIPTYGYMASTWATFVCYFSMMVASYFLGQKFYFIPYNLKKIFIYFSLALALFLVSFILFEYIILSSIFVKLFLNSLLIGSYIYVVYYLEKDILFSKK